MRWTTPGVVGGRRVTGTTFLVPMTSQETPNGVIQGTTVASIQSAMAAYIAVSSFTPVVYSREVLADPTATPPVAQRDGTSSVIVGGVVPPQITWLRSRRT
jgi:hypothetical protein